MKKFQKGQALIMVVLIGVIALLAVVSSATLLISELKKNTVTTKGSLGYEITHGALENGLLRLLRDPNYSGETFTTGTFTCVIGVTGSLAAKTIDTTCTDGSYVRKLQALGGFVNGQMTIATITEVP